MTTRFRTTIWPGEPVPVPPIDVPDGVDLIGDHLHFGWSSADPVHRELPAEFYLRQAREVDLDDLEQVVAFVREYGQVVPHYPRHRDLPHKKVWDAQLKRFAALRGRTYDRATARDPDHRYRICHVDEVIYRLTVLRTLTDHSVAYRDGEYEHRAWAPYPILYRPPSSDHEAWESFVQFTNAALRTFHVRVALDFGGRELGAAEPTVYEAAVLQLVNDLAEEVDVLTCAHCGRRFSRQVGRARVQNRLQGLKFCSPECGRAASVRAYRARKRAEREEES